MIEPQIQQKKEWSTPVLTNHGSLREVTQTGSWNWWINWFQLWFPQWNPPTNGGNDYSS